MPTENKLWLPPLSPKDQQKLDRLLSKGKNSTSNWTGFADRTLWDWIQFFAVLAIPIIVAAGTLYITQQITFQQAQASEKQHQTDLQIEATRYANDQQLATDQQRETTLKTYLDDISDLLLNHNLRNSLPGDVESQVARERTLTTLRRLDGPRNRILIQFLQDAHLISGHNAVINLSGADLSDDDLRLANLAGVDLRSAILLRANLGAAYLWEADLSEADLGNANLAGAYLGEANLRSAALWGVDFTSATLKGANLSGAWIFGAKLTYAQYLTQQQLDQVYTCFDTSLPKGLICHHNINPLG